MGDRPQPPDEELKATYERAIQDGRRLYQESMRFTVREPPNGSIQSLYRVVTGYCKTATDYETEMAANNLSTGGVLFVDVSSRKKWAETAYSHHVSGRTGLLLVHEIAKDRSVEF